MLGVSVKWLKLSHCGHNWEQKQVSQEGWFPQCSVQPPSAELTSLSCLISAIHTCGGFCPAQVKTGGKEQTNTVLGGSKLSLLALS